MRRFSLILKSKTFWGSIFASGGYLTGADVIGPSEIFTAVGAVVAAIGVRDSFSKYLDPRFPKRAGS